MATRRKTKRTKRSGKNIISGTSKTVTSGLNKIGKSVTNTSQKMVNRFFGLFKMQNTRKHKKKN